MTRQALPVRAAVRVTGRVAVRLAMRAGIAALVAAVSLAAGVRDSYADTTVIKGARVYVTPERVIEGATVVIRDGAIAAVGPEVPIPAGARAIDAAGKVVTAGLVDASTRVGLVEVDIEASTREGAFEAGKGEDAVHAAYRVTDGYNPASVRIPIARTGGITAIVAAPAGGLVAGTSAWYPLADDIAIAPVAPAGARRAGAAPTALAMYANLGQGALESADGSRGLALKKLRELLDDARHYDRNRAGYERNQLRALAASRLDLEAMLAVTSGRIPLVVRVHRAADILAALALAREQRIRVVIEGGAEAWVVADQLAAAGVGVILDPSENLPASFERARVRDDAAAVLARAGVPVAISTLGDSSNVRILRQLAGIAVANGLPYERALAAVTTVPAQLFGVPRGTITAGSAADLVVWSGDPFELSTHPEHVFVGGVEQSLRTRQTLLLERYRNLPATK